MLAYHVEFGGIGTMAHEGYASSRLAQRLDLTNFANLRGIPAENVMCKYSSKSDNNMEGFIERDIGVQKERMHPLGRILGSSLEMERNEL